MFPEPFRPTGPAPALLLLGILLLLPGACTFVSSAPTEDDVAWLFREAVRVRLESFAPGASVKCVLRAPDTRSSKRVHEAWGDNGYIVYAERKDGSLIPFASINLDVSVLRASGDLPVRPSPGCPYGVFSTTGDSGDCGVVFKPDPGDEVEVTITSRGTEALPAGDVLVEPYLDAGAKDRLVGVMINSDLQPIVAALTAFGIVLLITSAVVAMNSA